jgi:hypothetical protein
MELEKERRSVRSCVNSNTMHATPMGAKMSMFNADFLRRLMCSREVWSEMGIWIDLNWAISC